MGSTFLVDGWLYDMNGWNGFPRVSGSVQYVCPDNTPEPAGDPLDPTGSDWCIYTWLGNSSAGPSFPFGPEDARPVEAAGMVQIDAIPTATAVYGTYVVRTVSEQCPHASSGDTRNCGRILARVADTLNLTPSVATLTPTPTPTPTPAVAPTPTATPADAPSATVTPVALPTGSADQAPIGLMGSGNRPFNAGEFATLWAADPAHLAGRIVIVKGPVPTGFECWSAGAADAAVPSPACHLAILDGWVAQEGYWAVRVGADGKLAIVGQIATTQGSFVFTLEQAVAAWDGSAWGDLLIVDASLYWTNDCRWSTEPSAIACSTSVLSSENVEQQVQPDDAYQLFGSNVVGQAIEGLYLVDSKTGTILARLEAATP